MARPELGLKRQCMSCGAKFYDLDRDPAVCPKCGTIYQVAASSRVAAPVAARATQEDDEDEEKSGPDMVSLDEVEASEDDVDDINVDDEEGGTDAGGDDDTFLEEEDGDDDVSDLIDNEGDGDEEG
ncbi:TIGR02300 family protein [Methylobacterium organophilum]|uniref:TIGR02300 family protein n=1 Tax=Methylobacterium organophilum TaxID=410 RepID=UPI001F13EBCB|nr:TIGR02300 family protein [Methylobacterium organophilum]UMY17936.1 TIGR02300 family protein [Methylobacterium organophilum]